MYKMNAKTLFITIFGILIIYGTITYIPFSDQASLTNNPFGTLETLEVDENWNDTGTLSDLNYNGDLIYPDANSFGEWNSFIRQENDSKVLRLDASGDPRDGTINFFVNAWTDEPNGTNPDEVFNASMDEAEFSTNFTSVNNYNYYEIEAELNETAGSSNERPNLDSLDVEWINRDAQLGFSSDDFQVFTLFIFIASGLLAMIGYVMG